MYEPCDRHALMSSTEWKIVLFHSQLLFDPINPDKKTAATEAVMHKERLDNEFWLLQKLATVMEKANFHELSKPLVQQSLAGHLSREGIIVSKRSYRNCEVVTN